MNLQQSNQTPTDIHKQNVIDYFSYTGAYWKEAYSGTGKGGNEFDSYAKSRRMAITLEAVELCADNRRHDILDVGCGPGVIMEEVAKRGHKVRGLDISEHMVAEANKRMRAYFPNDLPCMKGDIENLPFPDASMDIVLCLGVLPYVRDDNVALREIRRVLKKDGFAILVMSNLLKLGSLFDPYYYLVRIWQYFWFQKMKNAKAAKTELRPSTFDCNEMFSIRRYLLKPMANLLTAHGFRDINITGFAYGPMTFWRRQVLPRSMSINMSSLIEALSKKPGFKWLTALSSEWVVVMKT